LRQAILRSPEQEASCYREFLELAALSSSAGARGCAVYTAGSLGEFGNGNTAAEGLFLCSDGELGKEDCPAPGL